MPRRNRASIVEAGGYYHVIARGNDKMTIFRDRIDFVRYGSILKMVVGEEGVVMSRFVLMPNHVHLLLKPSERGLSRCMLRIQRAYAEHFRKKYDHVGHVWQGRYKSLPILTDAYLSACGDYIEMNPVRAGLVNRPEAWPYSSRSSL
jgi:putative transposase